MACTDPFDAFVYATENLGKDIHRLASFNSVWLNVTQRGTCPLNVGTAFTTYMVGNTEPTDETTEWNIVDFGSDFPTSDRDTDEARTETTTVAALCTPNWSDVYWGMDQLTYGPEYKQMRGPVVCRHEFLFSHSPDGFLGAYVQEITKRAKREWELNYERNHIRFSRKAPVITDFISGIKEQEDLGSGTALDESTCELSQETLEIVAQYLSEDGAPNPDSNGFISLGDAGPIYSLLIGQYQSQRILRQNASTREDYRFAAPSELIKRLGASRVIGNFRHIVTTMPRRYTFSQGVYTPVARWVNAGAGNNPLGAPAKGTYQVINPDWRTAPYEAADVLCPWLWTSEIVPPKNSAGGVSFDPTTWMGEWEFVKGEYRWSTTCTDPLDDKGRHFGRFMHAPRPNPVAYLRHGWHIIFKRCQQNQIECTTCSS